MATEKELDMGGTFDWFGPESHPDFCGNPETGEYTGDNSKSPAGRSITEQQFKNRMILRKAMLGNGFKPIDTEWWHFTLKDEPFTETYFTFPVRELKNPKLTADDHLPSFPGGQEQLMMYLSKSIRYPEEAAKYGAQGKIVVSFMVNQDGTLDDFHIFESHVQCTSVKYKKLDNSIKAFQYNKCKEALEQEALRVAQDMPDWKPGVQYGKKIRVRYKLPITFRMR
jgi:TonB family protein